MKSSKTYIPCVIITIILVFSIFGAGICFVVNGVALNSSICLSIADEKELVPKIKSSLEKYFSEKYNATGIPSEVYMKPITDEWIDDAITINITNGFDYINGVVDEFSVAPNFEQLDKSISDFFSNYADENGYVKDSSYNDKLEREIENAHIIVTNYTDIFKFNTLYENGVLQQVRNYTGYPLILGYICLLAVLFCIILLAVLLSKQKQTVNILYWTGCAFLISSIIGLIPCLYITSSNYFDSFVIKQEQIFIAFTSFMYRIVNSFSTFETVLLVLGILMLIANIIIKKKKA